LTSACSVNRENSTELDQGVKKVWSDWIKSNHQALTTIDSKNTDYSDLMFLKPVLEDKRIVQLGENCHGVSEFNKVKVRLIKFLHEVLGYQVIAFESSVFECNMAQLNNKNMTPESIMRQSIFQVWHCEEALELFKYIKETQSTENPLIFSGFDIQLSSKAGYTQRPETFYNAISKIDSSYANIILEKDRDFIQYHLTQTWISANKDYFKAFYKDLYEWFDLNMNNLINQYPDMPMLPLILRQSAWSMINYIDELISYFKDNITECYNIRDLGMATNVKMLKETLYPEKKIMIWAHNGHIQHHGSLIRGGGPIASANNMGYWLYRWFPEEIYTIGLFMYQGEVASTRSTLYTVGNYNDDSLESILAETNEAFLFINLYNLSETEGNSWIFEYISSTEWEDQAEREDEIIIHKDHFNGIIFIRNVHPPEYLPY